MLKGEQSGLWTLTATVRIYCARRWNPNFVPGAAKGDFEYAMSLIS